MTKTEAKKRIKEQYKDFLERTGQKIVDWNLWKNRGEYVFTIITISKNHIPYRYSGFFEGNNIIGLSGSTGMLTVN